MSKLTMDHEELSLRLGKAHTSEECPLGEKIAPFEGVDEVPTINSRNFVTSDGIAKALAANTADDMTEEQVEAIVEAAIQKAETDGVIATESWVEGNFVTVDTTEDITGSKRLTADTYIKSIQPAMNNAFVGTYGNPFSSGYFTNLSASFTPYEDNSVTNKKYVDSKISNIELLPGPQGPRGYTGPAGPAGVSPNIHYPSYEAGTEQSRKDGMRLRGSSFYDQLLWSPTEDTYIYCSGYFYIPPTEEQIWVNCACIIEGQMFYSFNFLTSTLETTGYNFISPSIFAEKGKNIFVKVTTSSSLEIMGATVSANVVSIPTGTAFDAMSQDLVTAQATISSLQQQLSNVLQRLDELEG